MNEGSLRCDINISARKIEEKKLGTRTEMKNLNSFKFIKKAIDYEFERQAKSLENGEAICRETRRFDESSGKTYSMRSKEDSADYRFFREPDLSQIEISDLYIDEVKATIPELPDEKKRRFMEAFDLSSYDAEMLISNRYISDCYEKSVEKTRFPKLLANLMISELTKLISDEETTVSHDSNANSFAEVSDLLGDNEITSGTAKSLMQKVFKDGICPMAYVKENGLGQINDTEEIKKLCLTEVSNDPKSVEDYKKGKKTALKALMGKVMRATSGRANPSTVEKILEELLN